MRRRPAQKPDFDRKNYIPDIASLPYLCDTMTKKAAAPKKKVVNSTEISPKIPKLARAEKSAETPQHGDTSCWREVVKNLPAKKDYKLQYYFGASQHGQQDRDWVSQAISYFNGRTKRQSCKVTDLPTFVQGYKEDVDASRAPVCTFMAAKHVRGFMEFVAANRRAHNDVIVFVSVENSPFFSVL
jgi:hypothetical protein